MCNQREGLLISFSFFLLSLSLIFANDLLLNPNESRKLRIRCTVFDECQVNDELGGQILFQDI